ncbi:MAG: hydroxyacid dehydrogenase [Deltaproteobacteria bacterium]|nr:hydroxyacid dehydrogenase [Deltaproteobacteria bacterium]
MSRVLIADKLPATAVEALIRLGLEVDVKPGMKPDELGPALAGVSVLIVRSTKVPRDVILGAEKLALIVRAGAGVNTIDVAAASERGVYVSNCPGKNAIAVAELAMGMICAVDRRIPDNVVDFRRGLWKKGEYGKARGLYGRSLGLAGLGRIGEAVAERAAAFGMHVSAWSRSLTTEIARAKQVEFAGTLRELASRVEILSVHLPLTNETRGIIGRPILEALGPGKVLINTSRAEVVDEPALIEAVKDRGLRAGLDVFEGEPTGSTGEIHSPLASLAGVYVSHHIGASTEQAQEAIMEETIRIVTAHARGTPIPNCVNIARQTPARFALVVRHRDRPGVLAAVLGALKSRTINVEQMQNDVFEGARAACARIGLDEAAGDDVLAEVRAHPEVIDATVVALSH